jgi:hypothetical protein
VSMLRMDSDSAEARFIRFSNEVFRSGLGDRHAQTVPPQAAD